MEQTSSSAYPNVLVVDYVKKARVASPQLLMKAEQYLNVGYQKLLTFERPGGGFDWWGNGPPLVWLSAYGLQEFSDMAKVYPIDRGIIDRTQAFLMKKMDKDGTWSNIGATHGETIASMGNPKLLLTSYVVWSLLDSGLSKNQVKKSVDFMSAAATPCGGLCCERERDKVWLPEALSSSFTFLRAISCVLPANAAAWASRISFSRAGGFCFR